MTDYRTRKELLSENKHLAIEASDLARRNVVLEKENTTLQFVIEDQKKAVNNQVSISNGLKQAIRVIMDEVTND